MPSFRDSVGLFFGRPNLYGLDGSYAQFVILLTGYDAGWRDRDMTRSPLTEFGGWLAARHGCGGNLVWWVLVLRIALPELPQDASTADLDADQDRTATAALLRFLLEYTDIAEGSKDRLRTNDPSRRM